MTEHRDSERRRGRTEFWKEVVCPTASSLEGFFWKLAWFVLIVCLFFSPVIFDGK